MTNDQSLKTHSHARPWRQRVLWLAFAFAPTAALAPCGSRASCSSCVGEVSCGWCQYESGEGGCYEGVRGGPLYAACGAAAARGSWTTSYCADVACAERSNCASCTSDPMCAWCGPSRICRQIASGSAVPTPRWCPAGEWAWPLRFPSATCGRLEGAEAKQKSVRAAVPQPQIERAARGGIVRAELGLADATRSALTAQELGELRHAIAAAAELPLDGLELELGSRRDPSTFARSPSGGVGLRVILQASVTVHAQSAAKRLARAFRTLRLRRACARRGLFLTPILTMEPFVLPGSSVFAAADVDDDASLADTVAAATAADAAADARRVSQLSKSTSKSTSKLRPPSSSRLRSSAALLRTVERVGVELRAGVEEQHEWLSDERRASALLRVQTNLGELRACIAAALARSHSADAALAACLRRGVK